MTREESIVGCLLGTAVGDALGLAYEGLSKQRQAKMFPDIGGYHFVLGKGMVSDDTEHSCMVAQALLVAAGDRDAFIRSLARRFRWWLLGLPAGVGFGTLRACLKLWIGFPGTRSGVFSAGNGPAMRSALLGVCYGEQPEQLNAFVRAATRITHTDPKAELGALAVALAAQMARTHPQERISAHEYCRKFEQLLEETHPDLEKECIAFFRMIEHMSKSVAKGETTEEFACSLGLSTGISGYINHTLPIVLHAWTRHQHDFRAAVLDVIRCGGDTDTTAAIVGAIVGAGVGKKGIPKEWLDNLWEWPRSTAWIERLGKRLEQGLRSEQKQKALRLPLAGILARNLVFLLLVLLHGLRRAFPPYGDHKPVRQ
ncbi:MAG: ADP-ribosylglycohydrolase family protein [bacterium]|nr:ADP-ribosylglycohydrolase family protein [bacterium]